MSDIKKSVCSPQFISQRVHLVVKQLVGLYLLVQLSLQLLLGVLQSLDLLLRFVHLPLGRLQPLSQLQGSEKWGFESRVLRVRFLLRVEICFCTWSLSDFRLMCSSSACIFISFTLRSSLRFACCRPLLSLGATGARYTVCNIAAPLDTLKQLQEKCAGGWVHSSTPLPFLSSEKNYLSSDWSLSSSSWIRQLSLETRESWFVLCDPSKWVTLLFRSLFWRKTENDKEAVLLLRALDLI